jgi:hypothetical protein
MPLGGGWRSPSAGGCFILCAGSLSDLTDQAT